MKEIRILFTGVGRRIELVQAFRQAALVLNKSLKIYGADMAGTAPALVFCDEVRKVCGMRDENYISELVSICEQDRIDLVIPTIDTDLLILSENISCFEAVGTKVLISKPEMIRICRDKNLTSQFFVDCGLKAPMPVNEYTEYAGGFPAFIKPKDGSSSINAFKIENKENLRQYANQINNYIIQPFVSGTEYTIDIFCDFQGVPISIVPRERMAVRSGEVLKTQICMDEEMIRETRALIERFKPCGPMTVQCIREKTSGEDYYIEINPRFGGGAPLSMKAGARSAEAILKLLSREPVAYASEIADGAIYSRFDQSVCIDAGYEPAKIRGVIFDLDDTLYSEKEYARSGFQTVAEYLGSEVYAEKLWQYFEQGIPAIDRLLEELGKETEKDNCLNVYRLHEPRITLYDGVAEQIRELKAKGVKVGIITDGRPEGQRKKIKALGLDKLIDDIIITDELGGVQFRKPNDISFRIMQNRWRLPFEQMMYIGDNPAKDFQAPRQLGMQWVLFNNKNGVHTIFSAKSLQKTDLANAIAEISEILSMSITNSKD